MKLFILSDSRSLAAWAKEAPKPKGGSILFGGRADLKEALSDACQCDVVYYDAEGLSAAELSKACRLLAKSGRLWGVLDRKGAIADPASLFHDGAADYVGKGMDAKKAFAPARLAKVSALKLGDEEAASTVAEPSNARAKPARELPPKGSFSWAKAVEGRDYDFVFLYAGIDNHEEMVEAVGEARAKALAKAFSGTVSDLVTPRGGQLWMWRDSCGLALLPLDAESGQIIADLVRFQLDAPLRSAFNPAMGMAFSYTVALHAGRAPYRKAGDTGTIVSDSVNSIFHLGQRYAKEGDCLLTAEAAALVPEAWADLFVPHGSFEGRGIVRMRRLI